MDRSDGDAPVIDEMIVRPSALSGRPGWAREAARPALLVAAILGLAAGGAFWLAGLRAGADSVWATTTALGFVPASVWVIGSLRRRQPGVDLIALLALASALAVGEYLAGAVIVPSVTNLHLARSGRDQCLLTFSRRSQLELFSTRPVVASNQCDPVAQSAAEADARPPHAGKRRGGRTLRCRLDSGSFRR
jgi:hypothetical protein